MYARWVHFFRNGGAPTYRTLASAFSRAPTTRTILNEGLGLTPKPPSRGVCLLFASLRILHKMTVSQQTRNCDGLVSSCGSSRPVSTTSKGFQQTTWVFVPCEGRSKGPVFRSPQEKTPEKPVPAANRPGGPAQTPEKTPKSAFCQIKKHQWSWV